MEIKETEEIQLENILNTIAVGDLIKKKDSKPEYHFLIPSYQRGYRWDDDQVIDLLQDLQEFVDQQKSKKYCLQPIVVKKMKDGLYEVLDGQQRLTTIYILLKCLKTYLPRITTYLVSYQTRPKSEEFLEQLTSLNYAESTINDKNPDYYYISKAYIKIGKWLDDQSEINPEISSTLYAALVKDIEFIWYQIIEKTDAIEVFTRINIGKIPLTNAELVKAVFLSKNNLSIGSTDIDERWLNTIQNTIATEWDLIQAKLLNKKFWGFIFNGNKKYETRVDYILELKYKIKDDKNHYSSFRRFYEEIQVFKKDVKHLNKLKFKNTSLIENEWAKVRFIVDILEDWFDDHYYYHHIGYLITQGVPILELINDYLILDKFKFRESIETKISTHFKGHKLTDLRYHKDPKTIQKILLLYNALSTYNIGDVNIKFPFELFKQNTWSLEHIYAQNSEDLRVDQYETWLTENVKSLINSNESDLEELIKEVQSCIENIDEVKKDSNRFTEIFNKVSNYYRQNLEGIDSLNTESVDENEENENREDDSYLNDSHSIVNLALLDSSSNSSLNNSLFDVKRMLIIDKEKKGIDVPIETKRIFLKYHTELPKHLFYWTQEDKKSYLRNLNKVLKNYIS